MIKRNWCCTLFLRLWPVHSRLNFSSSRLDICLMLIRKSFIHLNLSLKFSLFHYYLALFGNASCTFLLLIQVSYLLHFLAKPSRIVCPILIHLCCSVVFLVSAGPSRHGVIVLRVVLSLIWIKLISFLISDLPPHPDLLPQVWERDVIYPYIVLVSNLGQ